MLHERSLEEWCDADLSDWEINEIMELEGGRTTMLKWEQRTRDDCPASGGEWFIRSGNMITMAEMLWWMCDELTCFDIYRMYICFPYLAYRRKHSESQSAHATKVRNARTLQHSEKGFWGLSRKQSRR